jgi:hypothetical protein
VAFERQVADLVDDDQRVALDSAQFVVERVAVLGGLEPVDPLLGGGEGDAVPVLAGLDGQRDREMRLAGAGRVAVELLTLSIRCRSGCGWWRRRARCAMLSSTSWAGGRGRVSWCCGAGCWMEARARCRRRGPICRGGRKHRRG